MAEQDMSMDIKINGAETAANTVERLTEVMGQFGGSLAVASGLVGQLEESLKAFKSIDASTLKNLKEISKLNSVVADAKWTDTHEKYQRAKYDIGGASVDVEYKKWQAAKLRRDEEFKRTELGKQREEARAKKEIETLELAIEKEKAKIEEMKTKNIARALANQKKEEGLEKKKASRYDSSFGQSILYGLKGYEEKIAAQRNLTGYLGRGFGNLLKDTKIGNLFGGGIDGKGINLGIIGTGIISAIGSKLGKEASKYLLQYGNLQNLQTQLGVVYGNPVSANTRFEEITDYATRSPYGVAQSTEFSISLQQSGVYAMDLLDTLKRIGDVSGGNAEKMKRISTNFAQIQAMGKATTLDLRQFANAGIPIYKELRDLLGVSQQELRSMTADGKITSSIIEQVLRKMTDAGGIFYGATKQGAQTFKGRVTNLKDSEMLAQSAIGKAIYNIGIGNDGKSVVENLLTVLEDINIYVTKIANNVANKSEVKRGNINEKIINDYDSIIKILESDKDNNKNLIEEIKRIKYEKEQEYPQVAKIAAEAKSYENEYFFDLAKKAKDTSFLSSLVQELDQKNTLTGEIERLIEIYEDIAGSRKRPIRQMLQGDSGDILILKNEIDLLISGINAANQASKNHKYRDSYLQSLAFGITEKADVYNKFQSQDIASNTKINEFITNEYKKTAQYAEEQKKIIKDQVESARKTLNEMKKLKVSQNDFSWAKGLGTSQIKDYMLKFFDNTKLDLSRSLTDEEIEGLKNNLDIIKYLGMVDKEASSVLPMKTVNNLEKALDTKDINKIRKAIGEYSEAVENIKNQDLKDILSSLITNLELIFIDEKRLNEIEVNFDKQLKNKVIPFWKRLINSVLGIPIEYMEGLSGADIINIAKDRMLQNANKNVATALLKYENYTPEQVGKLVKASEDKNGVSRVDIKATSENFRNVVYSKNSSNEVTNAYLASAQGMLDALDELFAQGFTTKEAVDKLKDPEYQLRYGYSATAIDDSISAFNYELITAADGTTYFKETTLKSASELREGLSREVKALELLSKSKSVKSQTESERQLLNSMGNPILYSKRLLLEKTFDMPYEDLQSISRSMSGTDKQALDFKKGLGLPAEATSLDIEEYLLGQAKTRSSLEAINGEFSKLGESIKSAFSTEVIGQFSNSLELIGSNIAQGKDATDGLAASWKEAGKSILSTIGASMTSAGLNIAAAGATANGGKADWGKVAGGLALAAAGGIMSFTSGLMSEPEEDTSDASSDEEQQKIQNLKDALSDLIDQAKTDAEYYQKHYLHKKALAENYSISVRHVNDAIITPEGQIVSTHPDDYLIATKEPHALLGQRGNASPTVNFTVINNAGSEVRIEQQQKKNSDGSVDIQAVITKVVNGAIASGKLDGAFAQRDNRLRGRVVTS